MDFQSLVQRFIVKRSLVILIEEIVVYVRGFNMFYAVETGLNSGKIDIA